MTKLAKQKRLARGLFLAAGAFVGCMLVTSCSVTRSTPAPKGATGIISDRMQAGIIKAPVVPPPGFIYTEYSAPLDYDFSKDGQPTPASAPKSGVSESKYVWIPLYPSLSVAWEQADIQKAADDAGIETIYYADYEFFTILTIFSRSRIRVYGE